ncbi:hypothetical protein ACH4T9_13895 [Micromonospora sp. NPDC020750]|uniref:hypothetical protein n=1 Tax=unclassified Micromonospora TaxID=2617518 RepID=UPI0037A364AE
MLSDDGAAWLGTAALLRAEDADQARAVLTSDRYADIEVHNWAFGGTAVTTPQMPALLVMRRVGCLVVASLAGKPQRITLLEVARRVLVANGGGVSVTRDRFELPAETAAVVALCGGMPGRRHRDSPANQCCRMKGGSRRVRCCDPCARI